MLIFPERNFVYTLSKPLRKNRDAFLENEGKIHEGGYVEEVFCKLAGCVRFLSRSSFFPGALVVLSFKQDLFKMYNQGGMNLL